MKYAFTFRPYRGDADFRGTFDTVEKMVEAVKKLYDDDYVHDEICNEIDDPDFEPMLHYDIRFYMVEELGDDFISDEELIEHWKQKWEERRRARLEQQERDERSHYEYLKQKFGDE